MVMNLYSFFSTIFLLFYLNIIFASKSEKFKQKQIYFNKKKYNDLSKDYNFLQGLDPTIENFSLDEWIVYFRKNLESELTLHTYFENEENKNNVILFIYNKFNNDIKHYEVRYSSRKQTHDIMALIYNEGILNDGIFIQALYHDMKSMTNKKIFAICDLLLKSPSFKNLFYIMFDFTFKIFEKLSEQNIIDKSVFYLHNISVNLDTFNGSFYHMVTKYIIFCKTIISDKNKKYDIHNEIIDFLEYEYMIKDFLKYKLREMYFWHQYSVLVKYDFICKISKCLHYFCMSRNISYDKLLYFFHNEITKLKNKLTQLTFIMFFILFYKKTKFKSSFTQLTKVTVFILLLNTYKVKNTIEQNNILDVFFLIMNFGKLNNTGDMNLHMLCSYKSTLEEMHAVIMRRFLYFVLNINFTYHRYILDSINANDQYKIICLLIQYTIQVFYILFNFNIL